MNEEPTWPRVQLKADASGIWVTRVVKFPAGFQKLVSQF